MKKRLLSLLLVFAMVISFVPAFEISASAEVLLPEWAVDGNGEEATPYIISNYDGLNDFAAYVNHGNNMDDKYIKLADDFGVAAKSGAKTALTTPIGNNYDNGGFMGNFDGNGKTVKLAIGSEETPYEKNIAVCSATFLRVV